MDFCYGCERDWTTADGSQAGICPSCDAAGWRLLNDIVHGPCFYCGHALEDGHNDPYCSERCSAMAEMDEEDDDDK